VRLYLILLALCGLLSAAYLPLAPRLDRGRFAVASALAFAVALVLFLFAPAEAFR
jgi:hypothetical protein